MLLDHNYYIYNFTLLEPSKCFIKPSLIIQAPIFYTKVLTTQDSYFNEDICWEQLGVQYPAQRYLGMLTGAASLPITTWPTVPPGPNTLAMHFKKVIFCGAWTLEIFFSSVHNSCFKIKVLLYKRDNNQIIYEQVLGKGGEKELPFDRKRVPREPD